jgi:uncharacterized membrane protein
MIKKLLLIVLVIALSVPAIRPLFAPGFFPMHDDTQPTRVWEMAKSLSYGQFPVRWVDDLGYGYGYPIFNFYAPLPYYIGAACTLAGIDVLVATKIMIGIGMVLAAVTMFLLIYSIFDFPAAVLASMLYMYAPYHAVQLYVRGSIGELYAYGLLPLFLYGLMRIAQSALKKIDKPGVIISSSSLAAIILSHNISGFIILGLFGIFLSVYFIISVYKKKPKKFLNSFLLSFLLAIGLTSFFTLPALFEKQFTRVDTLVGGGSDFHQHFVFLDQLWESAWGFAGSAPGRADGMSFRIGKLHILLGIAGIVSTLLLYKRKKLPSFLNQLIASQIVLLILSVFFMVDYSTVFWEKLPLFPFIQYPWRFLTLTVFSLSILSGIGILFLDQKWKRWIIVFISLGVIYVTDVKLFYPQVALSGISKQDYINENIVKSKISKISDEYLPVNFSIPESENDIPQQVLPAYVKLISKYETPNVKKYIVENNTKKLIVLNIADFPGWKVIINGQDVLISPVDGKIAFNLSEGKSDIEVKFENTPIRIIGNTISLFSIFLLGYVSFVSKWKNYDKKNS